MTEKDTQIVLGEIRALRREIAEVSLSIRVDTPWLRVRDNIHYGLETLSAIPFSIRLLFVVSGCLIGYGAVNKNHKAAMIGVDLLLFSVVMVGGGE